MNAHYNSILVQRKSENNKQTKNLQGKRDEFKEIMNLRNGI